MAIIAILFAASSGDAAPACSDGTGGFISFLEPPPGCKSAVGICTHGILSGALPSTYDFVMDTLQPANDPFAPNKFVYTGHSTITTLDGAVLHGHDTGTLFFESGGPSPFVTTVHIVDGTKELKHATGLVIAVGALNFVTGEATGTYESYLCGVRDDDD